MVDEMKYVLDAIRIIKVSFKLKGKFYDTAIKPAMFCEIERLAIKRQQNSKLNVVGMRMLWWISDYKKR